MKPCPEWQPQLGYNRLKSSDYSSSQKRKWNEPFIALGFIDLTRPWTQACMRVRVGPLTVSFNWTGQSFGGCLSTVKLLGSLPRLSGLRWCSLSDPRLQRSRSGVGRRAWSYNSSPVVSLWSKPDQRRSKLFARIQTQPTATLPFPPSAECVPWIKHHASINTLYMCTCE